MITAQAHAALTASAILQREGGSAAAPDVELIERIAAADTQAMRALIGRYSVRIFRCVFKIVNDRPLADDLVSEILLDVWEHAHRFERRAKVLTWLLAIARYKAMSALKHRRRHEQLDEAHDVVDPTENAEESWCKSHRTKVLRHCLTKLSASHREVLDLVYYQEQSIASVATIIGVPVNTVKTRMFYARKHLATLLTEAGIDRATI